MYRQSLSLLACFLFTTLCLNSQNVGVGTNTPAAKLHISGDAMIDSLANAGQVIVLADNNGLLYRLPFNGNLGSILTGSGTWDSLNNILWLLSGNSGTDPALNFIGTIDSVDLIFKTFNSEKLRITGLGNVGIGVSAPAQQLHTTGGVRFQGLNTSTESIAVMLDANGDLSKRTLHSAAFDGNADMLDGKDGTYYLDNTDDQVISYNAGTNILTLEDGGTVNLSGLSNSGTDDQTLAEVLAQGNNGNNLEMVNINGIRVGSASSPGSWGIYVGGTQYISSNLRVDGEIQQGGTDYGGYEIQTGGQLYVNDYAVALGGIHVGGTSDPGTDNLIVDGNVGVGTASPSEQVEVRNTSGQAKIKIRGDGSTATTRAELMMDRTNSARGAGVRMQNSNAGTDAQWFAGIPYNNGSSSTGYSIGTHASQPEYTTRSKLFIKTDGNVGIGTTSPGAKLQVSGQVKITGGSPGAGKVLTSDANGLATWETSGYGNVPVGSVIAWHKSLSGTPSLPTGWAECNGQTISDASSPYNGQSIPNMNGTFTTLPGTTSSGGRFIRGGTTSGGFEQDQSNRLYQVHADDSGSGTTTGTISESGWSGYRRNYSTSGDRVYYRLNGRETRPGSIKMVWIMRVK